MAGPEIVPSTQTGMTYSTKRVTPVGGHSTTVVTYTGPVGEIQTQEALLIAGASALNGLASVEVTEDDRGRATLVANYERSTLGNNVPGQEDAIQEFHALKVIRDIYTSEYFKTLTNEQILDVRNLYEQKLGARDDIDVAIIQSGWGADPGLTLMKTLYGHLTHGQETVIELAYEFTQTWKTTSDRSIRKSLAGQNTSFTDAQIKALMNSTTLKLTKDLPDLEWLKDPVDLSYAGRGFWNVSERWIGFPTQSIIYGGTFTGIDA